MTDARAPMIWALDVATVTGCAIGRVGENPEATSIRLAPVGATVDVLFGETFNWFVGLLERGPLPDILALEELLPPTARRGHTNTGAQHRLAGMHGIIRALARNAKIPEVCSADVNDVRAHFISSRSMRRDDAKRAVAEMCRVLGWVAHDADCSDALALWSYTAALINPVSALEVTPLFNKTWEDVARAREAKRRG